MAARALLWQYSFDWILFIIGFNSAAVKKQNNYNTPVKTDPFRARDLSLILFDNSIPSRILKLFFISAVQALLLEQDGGRAVGVHRLRRGLLLQGDGLGGVQILQLWSVIYANKVAHPVIFASTTQF